MATLALLATSLMLGFPSLVQGIPSSNSLMHHVRVWLGASGRA